MGTKDEANTAGPAAEQSATALLNTAPRSAVVVDFADLASWVERHMVSEPVVLENGDTLYLVGTPDGVKEVRIDALNPMLPKHISARKTFNEPDSFVRYLKAYGLENAIVMADLLQRNFVAELDYHSAAGPNTNQHVAVLLTPYDEDFAAWRNYLGKYIPQADMANFLEDMLHTVATPEPADLLDMLNTIQINRNVAIKSVTNTRDGTIKLRYEEEDAADILLPRDIELQMPIFAGTAEISLRAKLRYDVKPGGAVLFQFSIPGLPTIERNEFRKMGQHIEDDANVPVLYGQTPRL